MGIVVPFPGNWLPNDPRTIIAVTVRRVSAEVQKEPFLLEARREALPLMAVAILVSEDRASEPEKMAALALWNSLDPEDRRNRITTLWICGDIEVAGIPVTVNGRNGGMWRLAIQGPSVAPGRLQPTKSGLNLLWEETRVRDNFEGARKVLNAVYLLCFA